MDNNIQITEFDGLTQKRELQMLKTILPYMKQEQKRNFAILIKYIELQNTIEIFSNNNSSSLLACSVASEEENSIAMLNDLRKFCSPKEIETIDMITNMLSIKELL